MDNNKTDLEVMCAMLEKAKMAFVGTDRGDGMVLSIGKGEVYFIFNNDFMLVEVTDV